MVTVFKVIPNRGKFRAIVVNIFILGRTKETKHFTRQVIDLKRIIKEFKPREVIIDINGIGAGIADLMMMTIKKFSHLMRRVSCMDLKLIIRLTVKCLVTVILV